MLQVQDGNCGLGHELKPESEAENASKTSKAPSGIVSQNEPDGSRKSE